MEKIPNPKSQIPNKFQIPNLKFQISRAFTLLELLVVIGIIAILIGMGSVSYSTAQKKARDAKRKGDLKAIQNALEQCYSINGYKYPTLSGNLSGSLPAPCTSLLTYPTDPLGGSYRCNGTCDSSTYQICPPTSVNSEKMLETEDCSTTNCCVNNQQ